MIDYQKFDTQDAYVNALVNFIASIEGYIQKVEDINDGAATIGYGYTFNRSDNLALWQAASQADGIPLTADQIAVLKAIDAAPAAQKTSIAISQFTWTITEDQAKALLEQTYSQYEGPAVALGMPISNERIALVAITYNRGVGAVDRKMQSFFTAVQNGDRAEAWFQIRYNAQTNIAADKLGIANARYMESDLFGLYNDPANVNQNDALDVYKMWTKHHDQILNYENTYDPTNPNANSLPIDIELQPAATLLQNAYGEGQTFDPTHIFLADDTAGTAVDLRCIPAGNNLLLAGAGSDSLYGSAGGNDVLVAGTGNDSLVAEWGNDTLVGGYGNDTLSGEQQIGTTGNDKFIYDSTTGVGLSPLFPGNDGSITINSANGVGSVWNGTTQLQGGDAVSGTPFTWTDLNGDTYVFAPTSGTLTITQTQNSLDPLGDANGTITINNFNLTAAMGPNGYLGIHFAESLYLTPYAEKK